MKKLLILIPTLAVMALFASGCAIDRINAKPSASAATSASNAPTPTLTPAQLDLKYPKITDDSQLPQLQPIKDGDPIAVFHTSMGDVKVRFYPDLAPVAVKNFQDLVSSGYYNNLIFHRVIQGFMIQGGDPLGTGKGGESASGGTFNDEITPCLRNFSGALAMANSGPNTNGSQFFIVENSALSDAQKTQMQQFIDDPTKVLRQEPATKTNITADRIYGSAVANEYLKDGGSPSLDFGYTVFGSVYEGMDVVHKIAAVDTYSQEDEKANPADILDKPKQDVVINSIELGTYQGK